MTRYSFFIDLIFLVVFLCMLVIPASRMDSSIYSENENRNLTKYVPLYKNGRINDHYGKDFDKYFNDHFSFRGEIVNKYYAFCNFINKSSRLQENRLVYVGEDGWLFYRLDNCMKNFHNVETFSMKDLEKIRLNLETINRWCEKNGKHFYYFIAPDKHRIYGEFFPGGKKRKPDSQSKAALLVDYLHKNSSIKVIYPVSELKEKKEIGLLYYKNDSHWNHMGAYIGYKELMKQISLDVKLTEYQPDFYWDEYLEGDLNRFYSNNFSYKNIKYLTLSQSENYQCQMRDSDNVFSDCKYTNISGKYKVFFLRDSFGTNLLPYMGNTFNTIYVYWRYHFNSKDLKNLEESDILILENVERYTDKCLKSISSFNDFISKGI